MNRNSNKSSAVTTVVVLLVCLVIVTGSTFSLFTSQTSTNISVTSGNVEMVATIDASTLALYSRGEAQTDKFENGGTATIDEGKLTLERIAPDDKAEFEIVLKNNSTIDIMYRVKWSVDGKLAEVLTATVDGDEITNGTSKWIPWEADATERTKTLTIAVELPRETDGKAYMGQEANIAFTVEAVQGNGVTTVASADEFLAATAGGYLVLNNDINYNNTDPDKQLILKANDTFEVDGNGSTITVSGTDPKNGNDGYVGFVTPAGKNATVSDLTVTGQGFVELGDWFVQGGTYVANNLVVNMASSLANVDKGFKLGCAFCHYGTATLNNCVMTGATAMYAKDGVMAVDAGFVNGTTTTVNGGEYGTVYCWSHSVVTIDGAKVDTLYVAPVNGTVTIKSGTHVGKINIDYGTSASLANATRLAKLVIEDGATVDEIVYNGTTYTVTAWNAYINGASLVNNAAELEAALNAGATTIVLAGGEYGTIVAKSGITYIGTTDAKVDAFNLNGSENVTLKNFNFNVANAQPVVDYGGTTRSNACIFGASKDNSVGARNITIDGCTFTGTFENGGAAIAFADKSRKTGGSGNITVKNCTFETEGAYYDIYGYYTGASGMTFTIENNVFASDYVEGGRTIYLGRLKTNEVIVVKGNTFKTKDSLDNSVSIAGDTNWNPTLGATDNTFAE